jgi:SNF2 family DNA or RNA helicase
MVELSKEFLRYGFWLQPGLGKTVGSLAIVENHPMKTVVVCPKSVMRAAWISDAERFFPGLKIVCCWDRQVLNRKNLIMDSDADILVINIDLFKSHKQDFLDAGVKRLILDESSMAKNHKAQRTKALIDFADQMESVYLLSGTPAPNCLTEYYTQVRAINKHIYGASFYGFAARFFYTMTRPINGREVITGYKQRTDRMDEFNEKLRSCTWSLSKEDAIDLPSQTDIIRIVDLSQKDRTTYEMVYAGLQAEMEGETLSPSGQAKLMKLRQLSGGFYYQDKKPIFTHTSPKLNDLDSLLDELGKEPVVIWANFRAEIDMILRLLEKRGASYDSIDGRTSNSSELISKFQDRELQYLVCHPAAAGHGITLTAACYAIYYSMDFSYEKYQQSRDRIHRKGQSKPCTYYHLIADNTTDESILWAVRNKGKISDAVLRILKR